MYPSSFCSFVECGGLVSGIGRRSYVTCPLYIVYSRKIAILNREETVDHEKGWVIEHDSKCVVVAIRDVIIENPQVVAPDIKEKKSRGACAYNPIGQPGRRGGDTVMLVR